MYIEKRSLLGNPLVVLYTSDTFVKNLLKKEREMKKGKIVFFCIATLCLVFMCMPSWGAPQYLGESTWTLTITMDEHGVVSEDFSGTVKMAITRMGGTYYTVQGYVDIPDDGPFIMTGGGILMGETIYLSLSGSQQHTDNNWRDTGILHVGSYKSSFNGHQ